MSQRAILLMCFATAMVTAQSITQNFGSGANAFSIDFVEIGNAGNTPDVRTYVNPYSVGAVSYIYNLGKYEVSRDVVQKASSSGGLGITLSDMSIYGGNGGNRPAVGVSFQEMARIVNWLNTSKGYEVAYNFGGLNGNISAWASGQHYQNNLFRNKNAVFFLPTLDEWYKGAFADSSGNWHQFATGDTKPLAVDDGTTGGTAVYSVYPNISLRTGPSDVDQAGGLSFWGTMGQGGNVFEVTETIYDGYGAGVDSTGEPYREMRGGSWLLDSYDLGRDAARYATTTITEYSNEIGFRVLMIPEPSAFSLLAVGLGALAILRRRRS